MYPASKDLYPHGLTPRKIRKNVLETSISIVYCHERNTTNTHRDPLGPYGRWQPPLLASTTIVAITDVYIHYYDPDTETNLQVQPIPAATTQREPSDGIFFQLGNLLIQLFEYSGVKR